MSVSDVTLDRGASHSHGVPCLLLVLQEVSYGTRVEAYVAEHSHLLVRQLPCEQVCLGSLCHAISVLDMGSKLAAC